LFELIRNPPGTSHTPHSEAGCILLVKLNQFDLNDKSLVHTNITSLEYVEPNGRDGVTVASLYQNEHETVRVERWKPYSNVEFTPEGGVEIFIIEGSATEDGVELEAQSWLRAATGTLVSVTAGPEGTLAWIKTNHLKHP